MVLKVQEFLRSHNLDLLVEKFSLKAKRHGEFPNLVLLKYDQINSPMGEQICQECRGLILDEASDWSIVSYGYSKFWNLHEGYADQINWNTAKVYEKADGSLMNVFHYNGKWRVASSGMPDAAGEVHGDTTKTFSDLFWETWNNLNYRLPDNENMTFMFEMMTPFNRIIVPNFTSRIALHGVRNLATLREETPEDWASRYGWDRVNMFPISSVDDCIEAARELNPMQQEGFVVVDKEFNRVKIKSPQYVALHHMKDGFTRRRMISLCLANEGAEFVAYFPELKEEFDHVAGKVTALCDTAEEVYDSIKSLESQKEFALKATQFPFKSVLFGLRSGKAVSARDFLFRMTVVNVERMLGFKEE